MSRKSVLILVFFFLVGGFASFAQAVTIVDTGQPLAPANGGSAWFYGDGGGGWLAEEFTTSQDYTVTNLEGWIWEGNSFGNDALSTIAHVVLYGDGGEIPNTGNQLFNGSFSVPNNDPDDRPLQGDVNPYNWHGLSGLNIPLPTGTYWIAFETYFADTDFYYGGMGYPAPNFLTNDAYGSSFGYQQQIPDELKLGIRIQGEPGLPQNGTAIPEPSSLFLLSTGLLGLAGIRYKRF